ncbi:hypothetical protein LMG26857_03789 [Achromobacter anxifer]|nr:hypothetical protein LMG26857_03789 [Achromobacter anxifer]
MLMAVDYDIFRGLGVSRSLAWHKGFAPLAVYRGRVMQGQ